MSYTSFIEHVKKKRIPIYGGCDFNVGHMASVLALHKDGALYVFKEYVDFFDTPDMIEAIKEDFPTNKIIMHPDASGRARKTTNASISDIALLKKAGFIVRARSRNPFVKDRVAAVNNAFNHKKLFIDTDACPELTEALEQQIWMPNGQPDKSTGQDHVLDSLGYMTHYMMPVRELKPQVTGVVQ